MVGRSIAGALSHTLSFSTSIGPERGHEKRLINRTNTANILTAAYTGRRTSSSTRPSLSFSLSFSLPLEHHTLRTYIRTDVGRRDTRRHIEKLSLCSNTRSGPGAPVPPMPLRTKTGMRFLSGYSATARGISLSLSLSPLTELTINAVQYHTDCGVKKGFEESADVERAAFDLRGVITGVRVCVKGVKKLRLIGYCDRLR